MSVYGMVAEQEVRMMNVGESVRVAVVLTALLFAVSGCQKQEGSAEKAGKEVDKAVEQAGEKVDKAAEKVGEQIERAGESIQDEARRDKK